MEKKYDLVVFGASGFTGKRICLELLRVIEGKGYRYSWAVAGRSKKKLDKIINDIKKQSASNCKIGLIEANINDEKSLIKMCEQSQVILDCVGPYTLYGEPVVKACIEGKCDYVDITGEPQYIDTIHAKYNNAAAEKNVFIVPSCGFDSVISDMGVEFARQKFNGTLNSLECYFQVKFGCHGLCLNHGTYDSMVHSMAETNLQEEQEKLNRKGLTVGPFLKIKNMHWNLDFKYYASPYIGAGIQVTRMSQKFLYDHHSLPPIQFLMYMMFPSIWYPRLCSCNLYSSEGPTELQIKEASFILHLKGEGYSDRRKNCGRTDKPDKNIFVDIVGPELAYVTSPITVVQSAISLLLERSKLPVSGGVLTPASAFFDTTIIKHMQEREVKFEVVDSK